MVNADSSSKHPDDTKSVDKENEQKIEKKNTPDNAEHMSLDSIGESLGTFISIAGDKLYETYMGYGQKKWSLFWLVFVLFVDCWHVWKLMQLDCYFYLQLWLSSDAFNCRSVDTKDFFILTFILVYKIFFVWWKATRPFLNAADGKLLQCSKL